eukprot:m.254197 g.254197  ORF g.254197 m.254197 type:complete len:353 (-) comp22680_c8_seq6:9-1067(-)
MSASAVRERHAKRKDAGLTPSGPGSAPTFGNQSNAPLGFSWDTPERAKAHEDFMKTYYPILTRRAQRWHQVYPPGAPLSRSRTLKRFCRKGIPSDRRAEVWMAISGANTRMNAEPGLFNTLLTSNKTDKATVDQIDLDLRRTFPDNRYFREGSDEDLVPQLRRVLVAYSVFNPNVGYCQGMSSVAAMFLLVTRSDEHSFWLLATTLGRLPDYYSPELAGFKCDYRVLANLLRERVPAVDQAIARSDIPLEMISLKWFINLFLDTLPVETVLRVWDVLLYEGDKVIFRVALTLLTEGEDNIANNRHKDTHEVLTAVKALGYLDFNCVDFVRKMFAIKHFPKSKIQALRRRPTD